MTTLEPIFNYQQSIVPLEAMTIIQLPKNEINSCNLTRIVTADNHKDYAVKEMSNSTTGFIPACELFCYELARAMRISVPEYHIIRMKDGTYAFGSEWDGSATLLNEISDFLRIISGRDEIKNSAEFFSKVYALDIFVNNIDRHHGNFFVKRTYSGSVGVAYDFDKAWYEQGYDGYDSLKCDTNTQECRHYVAFEKKLKKTIVKETLEAIRTVEKSKVLSILNMMPEDWMLKEERDKFIEWWGGSDFNSRIDKLKKDGL